jgi:flagellin
MKIGFASIQTKDIGVGSRAVVSSVGGTSATTSGALVQGNLVINGVGVGPSLAQDDSASSASASASAIAKAAAINRVSNLSGVYAKAGSTVVSGASMAVGTAVSSGTVTINGVATDTFSTSLDTSLTRKTLVNAINAKTSITGVTATDTGDDTLGVTLEAADGRNINLVHTFSAATIGIKPTGTTFVGSYSLYNLDGKDINVSSVTGSSTAVATSGLTLGTFKSNQAIFNSYARTAQSAAPDTSTTGLLDSSSLILNGVAIGAALNTDDTSSAVVGNSTRASSAIAIAASINRSSGQSGVTAVANANILQGTGFTAVNLSKATIYINGVTITANTMSLNGVIDSFNAKSGQTGVVASQWGSGLQLTAADGRNISIRSTAGSATFGLTGLTFGTNGSSYKTWTSTVSLKSDNAFTVKSGKTGIGNLEALGLRQGTFGTADNGLKVNQIDVTTIAGASQAMTAIDVAINTVSQAQAVSGAYNNRFDSIVNNLSETNQNITASRSRILDTDYATETTSLAKQQIISQAATAMLAQANQSSQSILSLLK